MWLELINNSLSFYNLQMNFGGSLVCSMLFGIADSLACLLLPLLLKTATNSIYSLLRLKVFGVSVRLLLYDLLSIEKQLRVFSLLYMYSFLLSDFFLFKLCIV